jgi:hypothetical protein
LRQHAINLAIEAQVEIAPQMTDFDMRVHARKWRAHDHTLALNEDNFTHIDSTTGVSKLHGVRQTNYQSPAFSTRGTRNRSANPRISSLVTSRASHPDEIPCSPQNAPAI